MKNLNLEELISGIQKSYESGITIEEAEKLAGKFLNAQIQVANELQKVDLDSRMKKSGVKAVKAAVYMEAAIKTDKKPSDVMLEQLINKNEIVASQQELLDIAEVEKDKLYNYLSIFREAHIHYRSIAKGSFGG